MRRRGFIYATITVTGKSCIGWQVPLERSWQQSSKFAMLGPEVSPHGFVAGRRRPGATVLSAVDSPTETDVVSLLINSTDPFIMTLQNIFPGESSGIVLDELVRCNLVDLAFCARTLRAVAHDYDGPALCRMLQTDFSVSSLAAHQTRVALLYSRESQPAPPDGIDAAAPSNDLPIFEPTIDQHDEAIPSACQNKTVYKNAFVSNSAKARKRLDYGLPRNCSARFPRLHAELQEFETFMTTPSTLSQEEPIRQATATVYMRHARLFLGWYISYCNDHDAPSTMPDEQQSLLHILPYATKATAAPILDYLQWLQSTRVISVSYRANLLRGIIKLCKYRFRHESNDQSNAALTFADVPVIVELRKWHRDANKKTHLAPKASNEALKWLSWPQFLSVVQQTGAEVERCKRPQPVNSRKVAVAYQKYLTVALFAHLPDRQRTVRELQLGKSFIQREDGIWCIRHAPDDYKTGKTYGERPLMALSPALSAAFVDFLTNYRPALEPTTQHVFCQPRTRRPWTQDSVYQIVARTCFEYTGQRTNPHLLRDMIVTHVRGSSQATEQELEALALYMAHSIQVQRKTYDRRTLSQKVAPAIELMRSVNGEGTHK